MRILALDPATKLGFAHSCGESGTVDLAPKKNESAGTRNIKLRGWLRRLYDDMPWDLLAYESPIVYGGKHMSGVGVAFNLEAIIQTFCLDNEIEYTGVNLVDIKRHATGKGNANKVQVGVAAAAKWDIAGMDDNQIDALWLLDLMQKEYGK